MNTKKIIKINEKDNVVVALTDLTANDEIMPGLNVRTDIKKGHKIAVSSVKAGEEIIKYGEIIGIASVDIFPGDWVHSHNLKTSLDKTFSYKYEQIKKSDIKSDAQSDIPTFYGYPRDNGLVGTRNDIWVIPTVGCVNKTAEKLAQTARDRNYKGIDDVVALTHPYGCSQMGSDHETTKQLLASLTKNPNVAGVLIVALGCENITIKEFKEALGVYDENKIKFLITQESDEITIGNELINELAQINSAERKKVPVSKLTLGLKCGGSDAFSGITANPLLGVLTTKHINFGGSAVLTEIPETFGAEHILMNYAKSQSVFDEIVKTVEDFKDYYISHNQVVYENPSPGNKEGGITTLEEKSLGCITKGGNNTVIAVYPYAQSLDNNTDNTGLILLNGPGNDIVAVTALTAIGANVILFTTGRGTPLGAPLPTVKISTNNELATSKAGWIDFNAGVLLEGKDIFELADELYDEIIDIASGKKTKNEQNGYKEIAIWKEGVTL